MLAPMEPTASGALSKTPLAHLVVYCLDKKLRGALVFRPEGDEDNEHADVVTLVGGFPAKIRIADPIHHLGRILVEIGAIDDAAYNESLMQMAQTQQLHGQILLASKKIDAATLERALRTQIARKLGQLFSRPPATTYAYYEGQDFLQRYGGPELFPVDPMPTLWAGIRAHPSQQHVDAAIERVANQTLRLKGDALERFDLSRAEQSLVDRLRAEPMTAQQAIACGACDARTARLLVYALLLTKQVDLIAPAAAATSRAPTHAPQTPLPPQAQAPLTAPAGARAPSAGRRAEIERKAKTIDKEDYFEILGITRESSIDDAKNAYFQLAKTWHPDRLPADLGDMKNDVARVFTLMAEAYQTLTDQDRRVKYMQLMREGGGTPEDQAEVARVMEASNSFAKAEFFVGKNQFAEAELHAKRAFELDPQTPDHVALWVWVQANKADRRESGRFDDLLPRLDAIVADNPRNERARFYRAMMLKMAGRTGDAMRDFKEIAEQNPRHIEATREVRLYTMRSERDKKTKDEGTGSLLGRFMKKK